jgi:hypothetical protein
MKLDDDTQWSIADIDLQVVELLDDLPELDSNEWLILEKEKITLPSALAAGEIEVELHKGQVTDTSKDFAWPSVRSRFASEHKYTMQIASGWCIEHGTRFISLMQRLESAGLCIDKCGVLCSVFQLIRNMW